MNRPTVSIVCGEDIIATVAGALSLQGELDSRVRRGATVVIKPNYGVAIPSDVGATTHPDVVIGVIEAVKAAGAKKIVVAESSVVGFDAARVMQTLGVTERFKAAGAQVVSLDEKPEDVITKRVPMGRLLKSIRIFRTAVACDLLISVPVLKTHIYTTVSLGMKNLKGTLPDAQKKIFHRVGAKKKTDEPYELDRSIADMMTVHHPGLTVIDAIIGQEGFVQNAGVCGTPVRMNTVIAGTDFVATDAVGAFLMGIDPLQVQHIRYCYEMNLGEAVVGKIDTVGENPHTLRRNFRPAVPGALGDYENITVREGGSCSGCSIAIRCALNAFDAEQLKGWLAAVLFVGEDSEISEPIDDKPILIGKCACRYPIKNALKITGCPPPFSYVIKKLKQHMMPPGSNINRHPKQKEIRQ